MARRTMLAAVAGLIVFAGWGWGAEEQAFISNGVKIHYIVEGKGEPVLLIHGFIANIPMQWQSPGIIKALAKDYQVIAFDNRGHGQSGKPHDPKQYGMEMVEDAVRLLDHLKIKKAHVVGYSMGAMIANKLLTTHPDRLLSVTLGGAAGMQESSDLIRINKLAEDLEQEGSIATLLEALTPPGKPVPTEEQIKTLNKLLAFTNDTKALAAVVRSWNTMMLIDSELKANQVPTLALIGDMDPLKKGVDELSIKMANLTVVVIKDADHMNAFTKPEFLKALEDFLAKNSTKKKVKKLATPVPAKSGKG